MSPVGMSRSSVSNERWGVALRESSARMSGWCVTVSQSVVSMRDCHARRTVPAVLLRVRAVRLRITSVRLTTSSVRCRDRVIAVARLLDGREVLRFACRVLLAAVQPRVYALSSRMCACHLAVNAGSFDLDGREFRRDAFTLPRDGCVSSASE